MGLTPITLVKVSPTPITQRPRPRPEPVDARALVGLAGLTRFLTRCRMGC